MDDKNEMIRDHFLDIICSHTQQSPAEILNYRGRKRELLEPKQVLQYALRRFTDPSLAYQKIADLTFRKKHCTMMSNYKTVANLLATDKKFQSKYSAAIDLISKQKLRRCLIIGDLYSVGQDRITELNKIERHLIGQGKYPVLIYRPVGVEMPNMFKSRIRALLECGSAYILPDYKASHAAKLELEVALQMGAEIIYADEQNQELCKKQK